MIAENFVTKKSFYLLYIAYSISSFGDRMWTFAVSLIMVLIGGLKLIGLYQLIDGLSSMAFSSIIGNMLDRHKRNVGIQAVLAGALFFNALSNIASGGEKLAFTKDWIVVLATYSDGDVTLAECNSKMHIIDQTSAMLSPVIVGYMLTFQSYQTIAIVLAIWNLLSWIVEFIALKKLYNSVPHLRTRQHKNIDNGIPLLDSKCKNDNNKENKKVVKLSFCSMIKTYFRQPIFLAAYALALLYFTVLGSDGLGIGYAKTMGLPEIWIGYSRFVGSALGVLSAFVYPFIQKCIGTEKTSLLGFILQITCLLFSIISIFLPGSPFDPKEFYETFEFSTWFKNIFSGATFVRMSGEITGEEGSNLFVSTSKTIINTTLIESPYVDEEIIKDNYIFGLSTNPSSVLTFLFSIITARFGLWLIDIGITQIMQENVPESQRGTVFGVQGSICNAFSVMKDIMVILLPDVRTFGILIIISVIAVMCGFIFYITFICLQYVKRKKTLDSETADILLKIIFTFYG
ncbi:Solute carrier family 40 member 1 [Strongyloides ratti]|uniref:Solute carrier family 40 member n=1 Tax=Strongyloides ratti TaxID=34506 RepID=A0A090MUZ8_STRRB|nr:Solute carrier family 40 member 1 [Strongyloides ratti]CEF62548.1 Solute carrier family 40 member 1 [Strongyloides ratti]